MNWLIETLGKIKNYFHSGRAKKDLETAASYIGEATPIIGEVADVITGLTPTPVDDAVWASVKAMFPTLFDGRQHTADEVKLGALGAATVLLQAKLPKLSTTVARLAVQLAYTNLSYRPKLSATTGQQSLSVAP